MPTIQRRSIGIDGGTYDYSSLSAWEAVVPANLVSADEIWIAEISGTWSTDDNAARVIIDGHTTDADHYIEIIADPTASAFNPYNDKTGQYKLYYIESSTNSFTTMQILDDYVRVKDITVWFEYSNVANRTRGALHLSANSCLVERCQFFHEYSGGGTGTGNTLSVIRCAGSGSVFVNNLLFAGIGSTGDDMEGWLACFYVQNTTSIMAFYNNTIGDSMVFSNAGSYGPGDGYRVFDQSSSSIWINNRVERKSAGTPTGDNIDFYFPSAGGTSSLSKNNSARDATAPGPNSVNTAGSSGIYDDDHLSAGVIGSWDVNTPVHPKGIDFDIHLSASDTSCQYKGFDLSSDPIYAFTTDFDGEDRTINGTWDIGFDQQQRYARTDDPVADTRIQVMTLTGGNIRNTAILRRVE